MARRSNTIEDQSLTPFTLIQTYPVFFEDEEGDGAEREMLELQCPRCEGVFIVEQAQFVAPLMSVVKKGMEIKGRTCPYCMRCAEIPPDVSPYRLSPAEIKVAERKVKGTTIGGKKVVPAHQPEPEPVGDNAGYHGFEDSRPKTRKVIVKRKR